MISTFSQQVVRFLLPPSPLPPRPSCNIGPRWTWKESPEIGRQMEAPGEPPTEAVIVLYRSATLPDGSTWLRPNRKASRRISKWIETLCPPEEVNGLFIETLLPLRSLEFGQATQLKSYDHDPEGDSHGFPLMLFILLVSCWSHIHTATIKTIHDLRHGRVHFPVPSNAPVEPRGRSL